MMFHCFPGGGDFGASCRAVCERAGIRPVEDPSEAAFAIAPLLTRKLSRFEWSAPTLGTLIFHPSILPARRGPDAIRWALAEGDPVSGVTWFWADEGLDTGPICEQEPVVLKAGEKPGHAYRDRFAPAGIRALERAVTSILAGDPRRVAQDPALATYQSFRGA